MSENGPKFESMVRIDATLYARFKKHCEDNGLIVAGIVTRLVNEYMENPAAFKKLAHLPQPAPAARPKGKANK